MNNDICAFKHKDEIVCRIIRIQTCFGWVAPFNFLNKIQLSEKVAVSECGFDSLIDVQKAAMLWLKNYAGIRLSEIKLHNTCHWNDPKHENTAGWNRLEMKRNRAKRPPPIVMTMQQIGMTARR